jgi:hypothetical protein
MYAGSARYRPGAAKKRANAGSGGGHAGMPAGGVSIGSGLSVNVAHAPPRSRKALTIERREG